MIFHLDTSTGQSVGIVTLKNRIDASNSSELQKVFTQWLQQASVFIFDCKELDFIDSSGLGAIVSCLRKALEQHGDLKLAALGPKVSMIFELTKAKQLFSIFSDATEALQSFSTVGTK
ncbi:STAS domain-containing protein [Pelodictyon phaeoclathratiforme]|jgi:anti-sigma B factor antagonist|uniref:Anti-sigma factor antagonist n=1 Tax=Pelodictyon phaeoclathratiforme (strain DSM 5477 / BU-1) TaxID=324925 RepID=B4SFP6_PELPB|nr:STAS domain-containing protein [Pelodictyon phaeoclathratiforme]ACF43301.1 anti-sigma-factor antagonist [Pelodictyon phaeoclathratiforme BU-1]MBV5290341.1 STAS domain-containing protein [Pelodictyon phaeoclathratiforme]